MKRALRDAALWALAVAAASALLFCVRYSMLEKSPYPTGLDGYYYALQAKSFAEKGRLENPDISPGFYLCGVFAIACKDAVVGCKAYAAAISTALALSVFLALLALHPGRYARAMVGFFLCAASPSCAQFTIDYINNLTGLVFLLAYVSCFYSAFARQGKPPAILAVAACCLFALACASHLITACYAIAFTAAFFLARQDLRLRLVTAGIALAAFACVAITQRQRLTGVFSAVPSFPAMSPFFRSHLHPGIVLELSALYLIVWAIGIALCIKRGRILPYAAFPIALFFPFWNLDSLDMGYRMLLSAVPCSIVFLLARIDAFVPAPSRKLTAVASASALCLSAALCALSPRVYDPLRDPPYGYYRQIAARIDLGQDTLLIAHLGLNHVYTYHNDLKMALNYLPDFTFPHERIWRLAYGVPVSEITSFFPELSGDTLSGELRRIDGKYVLIREDLWQEYLRREDPEIVQALMNWYNPHTVRPSFIRHSRRRAAGNRCHD